MCAMYLDRADVKASYLMCYLSVYIIIGICSGSQKHQLFIWRAYYELAKLL